MNMAYPEPKALKWLFVTLGAMLTMRLVIWLIQGLDETLFLQPDSHDYLFLGKQLFEQGTFTSFSRTPVYPAFLGLLDVVMGFETPKIILIQIVISLLSATLAWRILIRVGMKLSPKSGVNQYPYAFVAFALLLGLDFVSAQGANYLLAETIFTLMILVVVNLAMDIRQQTTGGWMKGVVCGLVMGLAILCRPIAVFLPFVVFAWGSIGLGSGKNGKRRLGFHLDFYRPGVFVLIGVLSVSFAGGWMARNHDKTGEAFLTTISSINLYEYRAAWNIAYRDDRIFEDVQQELREKKERIKREQNLNEGEIASRMGSEGLRLIKETPVETVIQGSLGFLRLYLGVFSSAIDDLFVVSGFEKNSAGPWGVKAFVFLHVVLTYVGVGVFVISRFTRNNRFSRHKQVGDAGQDEAMNGILVLCGLVIGYFTLLSVGVEAYARFRIPMMPLLGVLAALGWSQLVTLTRQPKQTRSVSEA